MSHLFEYVVQIYLNCKDLVMSANNQQWICNSWPLAVFVPVELISHIPIFITNWDIKLLCGHQYRWGQSKKKLDIVKLLEVVGFRQMLLMLNESMLVEVWSCVQINPHFNPQNVALGRIPSNEILFKGQCWEGGCWCLINYSKGHLLAFWTVHW